MPPGHAAQGSRRPRVIRQELPHTAIIVLSAQVEADEITAGARVVDPSLVQELVMARRRRDPLDVGIAQRIYVQEGTVEKHVRSILTMLDLPESATGHRRVLAVLRFLDAR
jgi:DNA-binding NarL/FixJ family response regulator